MLNGLRMRLDGCGGYMWSFIQGSFEARDPLVDCKKLPEIPVLVGSMDVICPFDIPGGLLSELC